MKLFLRKYCSIRILTVMFLLLSFNVASFGSDLHNCLCKPEKVEKKKSCCSKENDECNDEAVKVKDDCCSDNGSSSCNDCKTCSFEKKVEKEQAALNESKITKTENKTILKELQNLFTNTITQKSYQSDNSPGIRPKVFLDVSNLRI